MYTEISQIHYANAMLIRAREVHRTAILLKCSRYLLYTRSHI